MLPCDCKDDGPVTNYVNVIAILFKFIFKSCECVCQCASVSAIAQYDGLCMDCKGMMQGENCHLSCLAVLSIFTYGCTVYFHSFIYFILYPAIFAIEQYIGFSIDYGLSTPQLKNIDSHIDSWPTSVINILFSTLVW